MNRLILIGNGFDIAHGLKTRYVDFLEWYWNQRIDGFRGKREAVDEDLLCKLILPASTWGEFYFDRIIHRKRSKAKVKDEILNSGDITVTQTTFFDNICKSVETKGWVDIENEYYKLLVVYIKESKRELIEILNQQLHFLQEKLVEYLAFIEKDRSEFLFDYYEYYTEIYAPIRQDEIAVKAQVVINNYVEYCAKNTESIYYNKKEKYKKVFRFGKYLNEGNSSFNTIKYKEDNHIPLDLESEIKNVDFYWLPDNIMLLSFNYTSTALKYKRDGLCEVNYIHGQLEDGKSVIFGYGDELDKNFKDIQENENNECLSNIKSIKYLESDCYKKMLAFIESGPFQIYIMGHSCGNSDRTLLNTLFEHENCISIKPYYYKKCDGTDNYTELVQNISRNFTDMKLMRDRVVNKTKCTYLPQANDL